MSRNISCTLEYINKEFSAIGAELITKEYLGCNQDLKFKCSRCKNIYSIKYRNFKLGRNKNLLCKECMKSISIGDIRKAAKSNGCTLLSKEFKTVDDKLEFKCRCGNLFSITWANYKAGHTKLLCSICRKNKSIYYKDEKLLVEFITEEYSINALWNKKVELYNSGILYIPIYSDEVQKDVLQSMLNNRNIKIEKRIYARNCMLEIISDNIAKEFLNENHIQGYRKALVSIGLFYNSELVEVMTFVKSRYNKMYEWELLRLASKQNTIIVGGASKLFKKFIEDYKPKSIVSYCDCRFCKPNYEETVYQKLGFKFLHKSVSNYRYYNETIKKFYTRLACQKHRLKDLLENFDENLTEYENMKQNGFKRLYDCGNYVFVWENEYI